MGNERGGCMIRASVLIAAAVVICIFPDNAFATQEHADPEGLYSHQIAHIFFMLSMIVLMVQIKKTRPLLHGWKLIGNAALLFFAWNLTVFIVHALRESIDPWRFEGNAAMWTQTIMLTGAKEYVFYTGKVIEHFILVGAMVAFVMGIRSIARETGIWGNK